MLTASGILRLIWAAPCTSMSSNRSLPVLFRILKKAARSPVVVAFEHVWRTPGTRRHESSFRIALGETKKYSRPFCSLPARFARGVGNGEFELEDAFANFVYQRRFTGTRRRRDDEDVSHLFDVLHLLARLFDIRLHDQPGFSDFYRIT